jgi:hypothetical protein
MRPGSLLVLLAGVLVTVPACRGAATTSVDEPPRTAMVEQAPPAPPASGGELALGLGDAPDAGPATEPPASSKLRRRADVPPPPPPPVLGAPCSPAATAATATGRGAPFDPCGTKGRVAVRWDPATHTGAFAGGEVGCQLVDLDKKQIAKDPRPFVVEPRRACAKDGKVWASTSCPMCRMAFAGWSAVAVISEMTKEQSLAFQQRLRLPHDVPLTTTEAWASALASAAN